MREKKQESKKKYHTPYLLKYGNFKKLTLGIKQSRLETGGAGPDKTRIAMSS